MYNFHLNSLETHFFSAFLNIYTYPYSFTMTYKLTVSMNLDLNLVNYLWCKVSVKHRWTYWNQQEDSHSVSLFSENWIKTFTMFKVFTELRSRCNTVSAVLMAINQKGRSDLGLKWAIGAFICWDHQSNKRMEQNNTEKDSDSMQFYI